MLSINGLVSAELSHIEAVNGVRYAYRRFGRTSSRTRRTPPLASSSSLPRRLRAAVR